MHVGWLISIWSLSKLNLNNSATETQRTERVIFKRAYENVFLFWGTGGNNDNINQNFFDWCFIALRYGQLDLKKKIRRYLSSFRSKYLLIYKEG